ncbi:glycosyltransferase family A protein [Prosthecobacter sp.]|uniref:glycosyltransferase family A protein n=1 Tax=Prosthecobacter sp. TaxID=1965333 RepID=UPI002ABC06B2|nr:glycosyltransferase family A protein [Prosthecobacter sp.]MDZ4401094.1 glycosyltransferase family A protein [Prosthecobacter sp.]
MGQFNCEITFVLSLKSKQVAKKWDNTMRLFEACVGSIVGQKNPAWRAVIVGHEKPECHHLTDPRIEFVSADFPVPPRTDYHLRLKDKWDKVALGLRLAERCQSRFIMAMDSDDLVSSKLTELAAKHPDSNGWIIKKGYVYIPGSWWIQRTNRFNCGTNAIVASRCITYPRGTNSAQDEFDCIILRSGHLGIEDAMRQAGTPLEVLPFRGAVYNTGHGGNNSLLGPWGGKGKKGPRWLLQALRTYQPLTPGVLHEFNLASLLKRGHFA